MKYEYPQLSPTNWKLLYLFSLFIVIQSLVTIWWIKSPSFKCQYPKLSPSYKSWRWF